MDLLDHRVVVALADELHFGRAATRLSLAQPALSKRLRRIEVELGAVLFERTRRRVELTAPGAALVPLSRRVISLATRAEEAARAAAAGELGRVTLGIVSSAVYDVLPRMMARARAEMPGVRVTIRETSSAPQVDALASGEIDVGITHELAEQQEIESRLLVSIPLLLAVPLEHRLATAPIVSLADASAEPFIIFPRAIAPTLHDRVVALCEAAGFSPLIEQEAATMQSITSLVAAGLGVAIVTETIAERTAGVRFLPLNSASAYAELRLIWRTDEASAAVVRFVDAALATGGANQ